MEKCEKCGNLKILGLLGTSNLKCHISYNLNGKHGKCKKFIFLLVKLESQLWPLLLRIFGESGLLAETADIKAANCRHKNWHRQLHRVIHILALTGGNIFSGIASLFTRNYNLFVIKNKKLYN